MQDLNLGWASLQHQQQRKSREVSTREGLIKNYEKKAREEVELGPELSCELSRKTWGERGKVNLDEMPWS